jgi:hypothetical protein
MERRMAKRFERCQQSQSGAITVHFDSIQNISENTIWVIWVIEQGKGESN